MFEPINVTKKDMFNGMNSATKAEEFLDTPLTIKGLFTFEDDVLNKETGEVHKETLVCLVTDKAIISAPSKTLVESVTKLVETFGDEVVGMEVQIASAKSNNGRTFYRIELI